MQICVKTLKRTKCKKYSFLFVRSNTKITKLDTLDWNVNYSKLKAMNRTNQSLFNHSNTSHVKALWEWNRFLRQLSTFRKRNCGWSASCTLWQFQCHIGALKYRNKIEKRRPEKTPTTLISQEVTHPSSNPSQQGLTSVTSESTWLIAIRDYDDDETRPKCLRGLPTHPT